MPAKMLPVDGQEVLMEPESLAVSGQPARPTEFNGWKRGYLQVYTGNGKGKTTAALGLTLRAIGNGARVFIGQFLKNGDYGEIKALLKFTNNVRVRQFGTGSFVNGHLSQEDFDSCRQGIQTITNVLTSGVYHLVVLDEIIVALNCGLLSVKELIQIAGMKPDNIELVFTGRHAPPEIMEIADLITEMKEVKHYYNEGVPARMAIEK